MISIVLNKTKTVGDGKHYQAHKANKSLPISLPKMNKPLQTTDLQGHKTLKSYFNYIKITKRDNLKAMIKIVNRKNEELLK